MARMFIALDISNNDQKAIANIQQQVLLPNARVIPWQNFHLTLHFLGNIKPETQLILTQKINQFVAEIKPESFSYCLTHIALFRKPQVAYFGIDHDVPQLFSLEQQLGAITSKLGFKSQHDGFTPHVSIFRKAKEIPQSRIDDRFEYLLSATSFSLYQSTSTNNGVKYTATHTWTLS